MACAPRLRPRPARRPSHVPGGCARRGGGPQTRAPPLEAGPLTRAPPPLPGGRASPRATPPSTTSLQACDCPPSESATLSESATASESATPSESATASESATPSESVTAESQGVGGGDGGDHRVAECQGVAGYRPADVVKLQFALNGAPVDALTTVRATPPPLLTPSPRRVRIDTCASSMRQWTACWRCLDGMRVYAPCYTPTYARPRAVLY
jgi:hypothetical protein